MRKCKMCKAPFKPMYTTTQMVCSVTCSVAYQNKLTDKQWQERKKAMKEKLLTVQELMKTAQIVFNKYIRLRDQGKKCISCQQLPKKENAGHFYSAGTHTAVRFDERNVHLQCEHCNTFLSGNLLEYRKNLLSKIGYDEFALLEAEANVIRKYTKDELFEIIRVYKEKIKEIKKV
jgi:hypothetical protein